SLAGTPRAIASDAMSSNSTRSVSSTLLMDRLRAASSGASGESTRHGPSVLTTKSLGSTTAPTHEEAQQIGTPLANLVPANRCDAERAFFECWLPLPLARCLSIGHPNAVTYSPPGGPHY